MSFLKPASGGFTYTTVNCSFTQFRFKVWSFLVFCYLSNGNYRKTKPNARETDRALQAAIIRDSLQDSWNSLTMIQKHFPAFFRHCCRRFPQVGCCSDSMRYQRQVSGHTERTNPPPRGCAMDKRKQIHRVRGWKVSETSRRLSICPRAAAGAGRQDKSGVVFSFMRAARGRRGGCQMERIAGHSFSLCVCVCVIKFPYLPILADRGGVREGNSASDDVLQPLRQPLHHDDQ